MRPHIVEQLQMHIHIEIFFYVGSAAYLLLFKEAFNLDFGTAYSKGTVYLISSIIYIHFLTIYLVIHTLVLKCGCCRFPVRLFAFSVIVSSIMWLKSKRKPHNLRCHLVERGADK